MKEMKGITYAIASSGTFGLIALFSLPLMEEGLAASTILFYRFLMSSILMGAVCLIRKDNISLTIRQSVDMVWLGILYALTSLFLIHSYRYIPTGIATTIHFMYPILVSVIMITFFKEKKSLVVLLAAALSIVGVVLMCWQNGQEVNIAGVMIAAFTVITYAGYMVGVNQSKVKELSAESLTFYILTAGAVLFFFYMLIDTGGIQTIPDMSSFMRLAALAIFCTVISDLTLVLAIQHVGSTTTAILGSMEPLVAVLVGIFYFYEKIDSMGMLGIVLIISSVILVVRSKSNNVKAVEENYQEQ